jgi:hypothetical protein
MRINATNLRYRQDGRRVGSLWHEPCHEVSQQFADQHTECTLENDDKLVHSHGLFTSEWAFQIGLKPKMAKTADGCPVATTTRLSQAQRSTYGTSIQPDTLAIAIVLLVPSPTLPQTVHITSISSRDKTDRVGSSHLHVCASWS